MESDSTNATLTPQAPSAARVPVYEVLAGEIKKLGVPVFGLMSDDTMHLAATLDAMGVAFHTARHENNAIAMADGFAAGSGKLGIALIGRGPAMVNGLHGAVNASRSGSRVLILFGDAPAAGPAGNALGPDGKALSARDLLSAAGLRTVLLRSPVAAQSAFAEAISAVRCGETVAMLLPVDVQRASITPNPGTELSISNAQSMTAGLARPESIKTAVDLLQRCRKPLFVCGIGAHRAGARDALERLADKVGAVLATTLKAKDMFRGHPYAVGIMGSFSHSAGRRLMDEADCVVVFGAGLNQFTTSGGTALPPAAPVIQVDLLRSHIGRWGVADVAVVGDVRQVAEELIRMLPDRPAAEKLLHTEDRRRRLAEFELASDFRPENTARTVDPRTLALELDRLLPADRNLIYDGGNFTQVLPYLSVPGPDHLKVASDFFLSVGMGFGAALGFAKARPHDTTVLIIGDGGFLMTLGELESVVREDIPLIIVLMNDCAYGAEMHLLRLNQLSVAQAQFPDVDFAPVAEAFGFRTATIRSIDDLRRSTPLLQKPDGPVLLDCKINASVVAPFLAEVVKHQKGEA